jgi:hypothetical protein
VSSARTCIDLGPLDDLEAHGDEDVGHALGGRGHRVPGAALHAVPGQGDVDGLLHEDALVALVLQLGLTPLERLGDLKAGAAHTFAGLGLGVRGQGADLPVGQRERRTVAGVREAGLFQLVQARGGLDRGECLVAHAGHLVRMQ